MKIGVTLFAQNYEDWDRFEAMEADRTLTGKMKVHDSQIYPEQFRLGKLVEPLGFDSLWTVEHHFTPYTMVNNPFQLLSYFAGCTEQIEMGTMVSSHRGTIRSEWSSRSSRSTTCWMDGA
jgi:hypothetical protein